MLSGRQQRTKQYVPSSPWALRRQLYFFCQTSSPARALMQEQCVTVGGSGQRCAKRVSAEATAAAQEAAARLAMRAQRLGEVGRRPCSVEKLGRAA